MYTLRLLIHRCIFMSNEIPVVSPEEIAGFQKRVRALQEQYKKIKAQALKYVSEDVFVDSPFRDIWGNVSGIFMILDLNTTLISQNKDGILRSLEELETYFSLFSQYPAFQEAEIRGGFNAARYNEIMQSGGTRNPYSQYIQECLVQLKTESPKKE